jgi:hypothetical protein
MFNWACLPEEVWNIPGPLVTAKNTPVLKHRQTVKQKQTVHMNTHKPLTTSTVCLDKKYLHPNSIRALVLTRAVRRELVARDLR